MFKYPVIYLVIFSSLTWKKPLFIGCFYLIFASNQLFSQEKGQLYDFGFHPGFYQDEVRIDKCKTYYDSVAHLLFNPCYDLDNSGIYSSYFARKLILGDCVACDSVTVLVPRSDASLNWEHLQQHEKETWDYYYKLWKKQDKVEKYYIDLEGIVRGVASKPF